MFESTTFEAGGYKWKLLLYPRGNKEDDGEGYISLYLSMVDTFESRDFEVKVFFKLFVFNQFKDEYLSVDGGVLCRFHKLLSEWGHGKLLSISTFEDPCNGYLVEDCAFGVEIYVMNSNVAVTQCVDLSESYLKRTYTWKINDFRRAQEIGKRLNSPEFVIHGWKWNLLLYPNGDGDKKGKCVSLFLSAIDIDSYVNIELNVKYKLRVLEHCTGNRREVEGKNGKFCSGTASSRGFPGMLPFDNLNDPSKKYLHNDTLIVQVEICSLS